VREPGYDCCVVVVLVGFASRTSSRPAPPFGRLRLGCRPPVAVLPPVALGRRWL